MQPRLRRPGTVVYMVNAVVVETERAGNHIATGILRYLVAARQARIDVSHLHYCNSAVW